MNNRRWLNLSWLRFKRIRTRFLVAMIMLTLPSIMLLGYISFNVTKDTLTDVSKKANLDHLRTSSEVADLLFRNISSFHFSIVVNEAIRQDLRKSGETAELQPDVARLTSNRLQSLISSSSADTRYVTSVCLLDLKFRTYCFGRSDDMGVYEGVNKAAGIAASDWYKQAYENNGKVVYYPTDIFQETNKSFSTVKLFRDAGDSSGEPIGILIVNVSKTIFDKVFGSGNAGGSFMVLSERDQSTTAVYNKAGEIALGSGNTGDVLGQLREDGFLVNPFLNQTTNWTFLHLVKAKELLKQTENIRWATTVIAAVFAFIALVLSYFLSGSITKPLLQLKKMMIDWTLGKRDFPARFAQDEVGVIGETFHRIAHENEELNARLVHSELKEREAELRALQSQIKPHFLYNTLDSIYWMALLQNNNDVAQMAVSLSESFKLSLNKGKETILVYNELKHIDHYLTIQNIRFNNRFQYIEDVEEQLKSLEMMKLLLQPLVENAIYHGLEPKVGPGTIRLTGRYDGNHVRFTVEDDGVGMADLERTEHGYGMRNVKERLALYYGANSSLEVWSEAGRGTRITLRFIPLSEPKKIRHSP
jgi:two-component system sensor histidine kinase YesM